MTGNTLTVAFPGAPSSDYNIIVRQTVDGSFLDSSTNNVQIKTEGVVTSFSPSSGSINGGTLITI